MPDPRGVISVAPFNFKTMIYLDIEQGSPRWHELRLGRITSTTVAAFMTKAKKEGELSATAKKELYRLKAERNLRPKYRSAAGSIEDYLERIGFSNPATRFGKQTEAEAREFYTLNTGISMVEVAFVLHSDPEFEDYWGDSPDGVHFNDDGTTHTIEGGLEIKCPSPAVAMEYICRLNDGESLKTIKPEYYWQIINHLTVQNAQWEDFMVYDPMQRNGYIIKRFDRSTPEIAADIKAVTDTVRSIIPLIK